MRHPCVSRHPRIRVGRRVIKKVECQEIYASVRSFGPGCPSASASESLIAWLAIEAVRRTWQGHLGGLKNSPRLRPGNVCHPGRRNTMSSGDNDTVVRDRREASSATPKESGWSVQQGPIGVESGAGQAIWRPKCPMKGRLRRSRRHDMVKAREQPSRVRDLLVRKRMALPHERRPESVAQVRKAIAPPGSVQQGTVRERLKLCLR